MTSLPPFPLAAHAPRPWLTREKGECAFPVEGEGVALMSCCNPSGEGLYCPGHAELMRGPKLSATADFERRLIEFLETRP